MTEWLGLGVLAVAVGAALAAAWWAERRQAMEQEAMQQFWRDLAAQQAGGNRQKADRGGQKAEDGRESSADGRPWNVESGVNPNGRPKAV